MQFHVAAKFLEKSSGFMTACKSRGCYYFRIFLRPDNASIFFHSRSHRENYVKCFLFIDQFLHSCDVLLVAVLQVKCFGYNYSRLFFIFAVYIRNIIEKITSVTDGSAGNVLNKLTNRC